MTKQQRKKTALIFAVIAMVFMISAILVGKVEKKETIQEVMRDAVLHDMNKVQDILHTEVHDGAGKVPDDT